MSRVFEPTKEELHRLRAWLKSMPHLVQDYDDYFLAAILRGCKGNLRKSQLAIEKSNALGMEYPEFFSTYDPLHFRLQEFLSICLFFPLPKKISEECTVIFFCYNPKFNDPSKCHFWEYTRYCILTCYVLIWEKNFASSQLKFIIDAKGGTLQHLRDLTPTTLMKLSTLQKGNGFMVNSATVLNLPTYLEYAVKLFKLAAKKKLADRIFAYSDLKELANHVPREMLPKEYGGYEESVFVLHENWKRKVESYRERFLEEEAKMRKLDPLRSQINEKDDLAGTFRQLDVD